jgi:hypothetical protein
MRILLIIIGCLSSGVCAPVAGADYFEPKLLTGKIYEKPDGRLLFTFRRTATQTGEVVSVLRQFHNPDGSLAAEERVLYEHGRLVRFELDERQIAAIGCARVGAGENRRQRIDFQYTAGSVPGAKTRRDVETTREEPLISDMLPGFLASHWAELNRGEAIKFRYLVVPRLETIGFRLRRESEDEFHGKKVLRIRMEPSSRLIAQFLDPLSFAVEIEAPHRILHYWGRTTPKIRRGQEWQDFDALTVFDWK